MDRLIRQYDGWEDATAADLLAWMATETTEPKSFRQNGSQLMKLLKTEVACALAEALESAGMKLVVAQIATPDGIDFGDDETQRMLTKLGESSEAFAPYVGALKALGQDTRTRWARAYGDEPLPQEAAVALARQQMLCTDWRDATLLPLVNAAINSGKTVDEIKAEITG